VQDGGHELKIEQKLSGRVFKVVVSGLPSFYHSLWDR
jgi:hypothetical protein